MSGDASAQQGKSAPAEAAVVPRPTGAKWIGELAAVAWLGILGLAAIVVGGHDALAGTAVGRGQTFGLEEADKVTPVTTERGVTFLTRLPEAGWLRKLTRGDRYRRVLYRSNSTTSNNAEIALP